MKYVNVVIDNKSKYTDTFYTYSADDSIRVGDVVYVPFNRGNSLKTAYVFQTDVEPECELSKIKAVDSVDPIVSLTEEIIDTCRWMKSRYGIKYLDAVKCFLQPGKPAKAGREKEPYRDEEGETQDIRALTA